MGYICLIDGCYSSSGTTKPKVSFFSIPSQSVAKYWDISKQCRDGTMHFSEFVHSGYLNLKVCEKHFLPGDIQTVVSTKLNRKHLASNATPHQLHSPSLSESISYPSTTASPTVTSEQSIISASPSNTGPVAPNLDDQAQQVS